jgi:predicted RecA/RadA family phage recombinase
MSVVFPKRPIDLGRHARELPADGSVPGAPGWRWIPTPGHAPGHVSLLRDSDRTVIAGDAFTTTKQESLIAALTQRAEIHGPPMYFTPDWDRARASVRHLADYAPTAAITGHGPPFRGERLQDGLRNLAAHFDQWARPARGRYRDTPAITDGSGLVQVPPAQVSAGTVVLAGLAIGAAIAIATSIGRGDDEDRRTEEIARLTSTSPDDVVTGAPDGTDAGTRAGDVSLLAQTLNESVSEVDAR